MDKITFCIPSKDNLRYLKTCISSIRKYAWRKDHDIIVFVDSDNDGTVKWLDKIKEKYNIQYYVNPKLGHELYGIGRAYDYCIEKSTTDIFMIFHADMILGKDADLKAFNYLKPKTVVCSTRIEPPLHPNGGEKVLEDFGMYPEEFKENEFNQYIKDRVEQFNEVPTTEGIFAPWMMYKDEFLTLGGHDPIMHSCREDSDIFNRMLLDNFTFIQSWESFVYHFTGRGAGSFDGDPERHKKWQADMNKSTLEFIRKWGQNVNHTPLMKPIVSPKYDIGFIVKNCNNQLLAALEPWCSAIYVDEGNVLTMIKNYIDSEQPNTSFDLHEIVRPFDNEKNNEILVTIDGNKFTQQDFQYIQQLSQILADSGEPAFHGELGNLTVEIFETMTTLEKDLIICKN